MAKTEKHRRHFFIGFGILLIMAIGLSSTSVATASTTHPAHTGPQASTARQQGGVALVSVRVEGASGTIFEGQVLTTGHVVTTPSGGSHPCNGLNNGDNPRPGPTATSALDDASRQAGFTWDGTYFASFQDFFVTQIADTAQTATQFWGILDNYELIPVGGCQQEVHTGDQLLFAFDAFNAAHFLKLTGPAVAVAGRAFTVKVTDGSTGAAIAGATVGGVVTGSNGTASITLPSTGIVRLKAESPGSIRSNAVNVTVVP